ncbi:MAG: RraA family protein [Anaerolineae bacterium]
MNRYSAEYYDAINKELYTAVLADIMDRLGYREQIVAPHIRPLYPEATIVGRAATMLAVDTYEVPERPYEKEMELLDDLVPGEVVVCTWHGTRPSAIWGELLSTCARARGGRGAIVDGYSRDSAAIREMAFPVFAAGLSPADSMGRCEVIEIRVPVELGGVSVNDGDLVVADFDGCVFVPQAIEEEVIAQAMEKVRGENVVRDELRQGKSIREVFARYGIL